MDDASASSRQQTSARRAVAAYQAMLRWLYLPDGSGLYAETAPTTGNPYAYVWPCSRALLATLCLAGVPSVLLDGASYAVDVEDRLRGLEAYWDRTARLPAYASYVLPPRGGGGDRYYDDNVWLGLAHVLQYRLGLGTSLARAQQVFAFGQAGWNHSTGDPRPGGIFWIEQGVGHGRANHDRGAGATAAYAELGFHLHELTGASAYDGDGEVAAQPRALGASNMLGWVVTHLDSGGRGQGPFWNLVRDDGSIDTNLWSYNQGVLVGASLLAHRLSGDGHHLWRAENMAWQALATFGDFRGQPPTFNAMCFQNLLMLWPVTTDADLKASLLQAMQGYADWAWHPGSGAHDAETDLFYFDEAGRPTYGRQPARLEDQGAMAQLFALLAWRPADYARLT